MDFFEAIIKNKRFNAFRPNSSLTNDQIQQMLACAQLAPSLSEIQNFAYIIVTDKTLKEQIAQGISNTEVNIADAAVIIAVVVVIDENDDKNVIDAIIASNQLILAATTLNLGSNFIVEFGESINQLLMVEGELSIIGLIPIGETTDKGFQGLKRSISDLAFHNTINKKFNFDK
jgi:nitroreductase